MEDKGQIQSGEFDTAEHELRLYPVFLRDVCRLEEQIMELDAELAAIESGYGVSSPRIKGTEEAKYKDPPKVYISDAPISMIMQKEKLARRMRDLTTELLVIFGAEIQHIYAVFITLFQFKSFQYFWTSFCRSRINYSIIRFNLIFSMFKNLNSFLFYF